MATHSSVLAWRIMDRGAWWVTVHRVAKSWTKLCSFVCMHTHINIHFSSDLVVNNSPAEQETWVPSLGWEDPLEEDMATHSSILAWRIPWTGAWWARVRGVTKSWT